MPLPLALARPWHSCFGVLLPAAPFRASMRIVALPAHLPLLTSRHPSPQMRAEHKAQLAAAGLADDSEDDDDYYPASLPPW